MQPALNAMHLNFDGIAKHDLSNVVLERKPKDVWLNYTIWCAFEANRSNIIRSPETDLGLADAVNLSTQIVGFSFELRLLFLDPELQTECRNNDAS